MTISSVSTRLVVLYQTDCQRSNELQRSTVLCAFSLIAESVSRIARRSRRNSPRSTRNGSIDTFARELLTKMTGKVPVEIRPAYVPITLDNSQQAISAHGLSKVYIEWSIINSEIGSLTDLQRISHAPRTEEVLATLKLVRAPIGQTRVEPDVLLVVGEAPERYPELKLLGHRWINVFHQLERYMGRHATRRELAQRRHCLSIWKKKT